MLNEAMLLAQNKRLREENEELHETVRQMQAEALRTAEDLPAGLPILTNLEDKLLRVLLARPGVRTTEYILQSLYRGHDEAAPNIIKVMVYRLRKKVGHVVKIETVWGRGYVAKLVNEPLRDHVETGVSSNSEQRAA